MTPPPETDAKKLVALLAVPTEEFSAFTTADCVLCVVTTIAVINTDAGETVSVTAERPTLASKAKSMAISSSLLAVKSLTSPTATIVTTTLYCVPTAAGAPGGAAASGGGEGEQELCPNARLPIVMAAGM